MSTNFTKKIFVNKFSVYKDKMFWLVHFCNKNIFWPVLISVPPVDKNWQISGCLLDGENEIRLAL